MSEDFPKERIESMLGPRPSGNPSGMIRAANSWSAAAKEIRAMASALESEACPSALSTDSDTASRVSQNVDAIYHEAKECDARADHLRRGAALIEHAQLAWMKIGIAAIRAIPGRVTRDGRDHDESDRTNAVAQAARTAWQACEAKLIDDLAATARHAPGPRNSYDK